MDTSTHQLGPIKEAGRRDLNMDLPLRPKLLTYPFVPPPELRAAGPSHPVVIVGAGPVGLTLALTLARAGVRSVVLENDDRVCGGSRALGLSRRTLEIWDALAVAEPVTRLGKKWTGGRSFFAGQTILQFDMPDDPALRHRPMLNLQQCYSEHFLVARASASSLVDLRWQSRFVGLRQESDSVKLDVATPLGNYTLQASYVAACDGARSAVRTAMGLTLEGASYEADYVIADIELETDAPTERRCWFDPPSNPGLSVLMHGQPGGIWRLDYQLGAGEDPKSAVALERVHRRIQKHLDYIGEKGAWRLEDVSHYRVHSRSLSKFRHDRVLFAGDAAHLMPIFGIRGLNSGVEDAWALGAKLAEVLRGTASDALLDVYSQERRAVFDENAAAASRNAVFMTPPSAGMRRAREAALMLALGATPLQDLLNPRQAAYVPLRHSPLSTPDRDEWAGGPAPGEVLPDLLLPTPPQGHLQSVIATRSCALWFRDPADNTLTKNQLQQLDLDVVIVSEEPTPEGGEQIHDPDGTLRGRMAAGPGALYLIRPDHNVAARWKAPDLDSVEAAVNRLALKNSSNGEPTLSPPALSAAERVYNGLSELLDRTSSPLETLTALVLRLGVDIGDAAAFERAVRAVEAAQDVRERVRHTTPQPDQSIGVPVNGLHHFAWKCRDAEETRHFYEDLLGLPLVHTIQASRVPSTGEHCPYVHLFFELVDGSSVAFFDLGDGAAPLPSSNTPDWVNHLALKVPDRQSLLRAKERLEAAGVSVLGPTDHHFVDSIYFHDPNGIRLELTWSKGDPRYLEQMRRQAHDKLRQWVARDAKATTGDTAIKVA